MSVDSEDEEDGEGEVEDQVDLPQQQKQALNYGGSQDDYHQRQLVNPRVMITIVWFYLSLKPYLKDRGSFL